MYNTEFSLHSVLSQEQDLEKALFEIIKVKKIGDLSQSVLKQSNKETVMKLVSTLSCALTRTNELLRLAAADVDTLKTEQLRCQNELLASKNEVLTCKKEELSEVTSTVKTEIKSWAEVVTKNCASNVSITPKKIKEAVKSAVIEEDRLYNVMMYGVEELDEDDSNDEDKRQIAEIMGEIGVVYSGDVLIGRVGDVKEGSTRPIRVRMERKESVLGVLARARQLKNSETYSAVFLGPDRTLDERKAHKKLVEELKKKRSESPDRVFFIRENSICSKPRQSIDN